MRLRDQSSQAESDYYRMAVQNDVLDARVQGLSFEQEMRLIQDSEHKLHMLQTDTADAKQRSKRLQEQCGLSL